MRARAAGVGVIAVLAAAAGAVAVWLAHPRSLADVRYAGAQGAMRARVALQLGGASAPDEITVDLGAAGKIVARRLP